MDKRAEELLRDLEVTRGCRFGAAERLNSRDRRMALLVAVASALVIALTVLPFIYKLPFLISGDLSVVTLVMSILILAVSLFQYSTNDAVSAEQHHRCGLEISELRRELRDKSETIDDDGLDKIRARYDAILQKYSINHSELDFRKYQIEHPAEFQLSLLEKSRVLLRLAFSGKTLQTALIGIIVCLFFWLLFWHVLPARLA